MPKTDLDEEYLQAWVDACSEGAGVAVLQCLQAEGPIGYATLSDATGQHRLAMVLVILGDDLIEEVLEGMEKSSGARIVRAQDFDS